MKLIDRLKKFVKNNTTGRDPSHGYEHMEKVFNNAIKIYSKLIEGGEKYNDNVLKYILLVSWLHDVADHKYDRDGLLMKKVMAFLYEHAPKNAEEIRECIKCISFSREKKEGIYYYENILSPMFVFVRNIVSDADKLEALGVVGIERCEEYTKRSAEEKGIVLGDEELRKLVLEHCNEKLFILASQYMRTRPGRVMAGYLEAVMKERLFKSK